MNDKRLSIVAGRAALDKILGKTRPYSFLAFIIFTAAIYGFVVFRINNLKSTEPSSDQVSSQIQADRVPKIDPDTIKQLESLQDNSVSVQTLFDQARNNPFQ
jgi:hypothetical protein